MKLFIRHRVNSAVDLVSGSPEWGVEIDLRSDVSRPGALHLAHDPWSRGEDFETWLAAFVAHGIRGPILLNTKEDGLEMRIQEILRLHSVSSFLFLDTAFPTFVRWAKEGLAGRFMLRYSTYESIEAAELLCERDQWLWIDCFDGTPVAAEPLHRLKDRFRFCLVSPELQGRPIEDVSRFRALFDLADAVCTKNPEAWLKRFSA